MQHVRARRIGQSILDASFWPVCLLFATIARYNFRVEIDIPTVLAVGLIAGLLQIATGWLMGLYHGRYVYGSFEEVLGVSISAGLATILTCVFVWVVPGRPVPISAVLVGGISALLMMLAMRYLLRAAAQRPPSKDSGVDAVVVFGAGDAGVQLVRSIQRDAGSPFRVAALLDDDPAKRRLRIGGVSVGGGRNQIESVARTTGATSIIVAIAGADAPLLQDVAERARQCGLQVKVIPTLAELVHASVQVSDVRDISDVDLLGRRPVTIDLTDVSEMIRGRRVLITGAGGSIGSELSRQVHRFSPSALGLLDRDESALHALELSIHGRALLNDDSTILASIRDADALLRVFKDFGPDIVFHAAALKHLPMLERFPEEAVKTNVFGTLNVLEVARATGVQIFVNISTDKAADPISVLGYSKRLTERITAGFANRGQGKYVSVRFGNVLGSRGSVLSAFQAQIEAGGPVTVTDPQVTRFFMTVSEAVQLVLQAAAVGDDGEALVLDMGESVRIDDVANQLIDRSGRSIDIVYTGLRDGEKLDEVLFAHDETDERSAHPLISHVNVPPLVVEDLDVLKEGTDSLALVETMKRLSMNTEHQVHLASVDLETEFHPASVDVA